MSTAILITARLKSTRLPMKILKPIKGRPMLCHLLDRLKRAKVADKIIICTSPVAQDDPLEEVAEQEGVACFRGDPDDVLLRMTDAARRYGLDYVVSCTADNPFVDPEYIDRLYHFHRDHGNDFSNIEGMPFGTFNYLLSVDAMEKACEIKDAVDTEVWGGYFTQTGLFRCGTMRADTAVWRPELRLTVDYQEDFVLVKEIFERLYIPGEVFSLIRILELFDRDPALGIINSRMRQLPGKPIKLKSAS